MLPQRLKSAAGRRLKGPMSKEEFLQRLETAYEVSTLFAERALSKRASNSLSHRDSGWIVAQPKDNSVVLYDSVQSVEKYCRLPGLESSWCCGKHAGTEYWILSL